jgi:hypothetical protein
LRKALRLSARVLEPEYLGQGHGLVETLVVENPKDDRIAVVVAQGHGARCHATVAALRFVVAHHIGAQAAFARIGAGRLVVRNFLRRDQQGSERIDQGRFA